MTFAGKTEEAFNLYKSVFGGEFNMIQRFSEVPNFPHAPNMTAEQLNKIMHVSFPVANITLMGTDTIEGLHTVDMGDNISISVETPTREEADRLFAALSEGGKVDVAMKEEFRGAYFGMCTDKFGIHWMFNCENK